LVAWVRIDEVDRQAGIVSAGRSNRLGRGGFFLGQTADNRFTFALATHGAAPSTMTAVTNDAPLVAGKWYHVAATYDGKEMALVVNGSAKGAATSPAQSGPVRYPKATTFLLGARKDEERHWPLRGALKEVLVYHRALSITE